MCSFKTFSVPCLFLSVLVLNLNSANAQEEGYTPVAAKPTRCYDPYGKAQRCIPEFENAAFNVMMEATNTCGERGDQEFCNQAGFSEIKKSCELCHPNQHHAQYLTDFHNSDAPTWWQSETMMEGIQYPNQVNLTLRLGKAYDITYIRLWFMSPRPESFAIYKRSSENSPWIPFQYYSASCRDTYGLPDTLATIKGEESRALCKSEYSDISPLRGGNVVFSSLDGRPSAYFYDVTPELHEWVTATDIRITLDRLNTFGEEVFGVEHVLRSYFYAIADINVGARCKCNGHASECPESTSLDGSRRRVCKCEHNTAGPDCNECLPFYNDAPWKRGSAKNAFECKKCNCNNYSERCYFDKDLYEQTGHGGHCLDCRENRDGPNCERCRENYYMREDGYCIACDCDAVGSRNLQCNSEGKCQCKVGVGGDKCNRCEINHFDFGNQGCKNCGCSEIGSYDNKPTCNQNTGTCDCKENVEGKRCRECKPGYFNLDAINEFGCTPCFCYGHSSQCVSATGYSKYTVGSNFAKSSERWRAEDEYRRKIDIQYNALSQSIGVTSAADEIVYFVAPERFLGDQRASYNQILQFTLRIGNNRVQPSPTDVILEGSGERVATTIFAQRNNKPGVENQVYKFRLHEDQKYGWEPRLSAIAFISILTNLTAIRIRGTFAPHDVGFLDDIKLETAHRGIAGESVRWVEQCDCPTGYVGQFCESCAPGYRHAPSLGGPFMKCIPCDCNKHADICDSETGRCICQHNTGGDNCEVCARGYYGNALGGTTDDCQPCGCPNGGACIQIGDNETICTECPVGYTGHRCDACYDGYFGDPTGKYGPEVPCQACECNENIDNNAIGNCNTTTGECLKCIHNTGGDLCEKCLPGYYGNALALPKGNCHPCECFSIGTEDAEGALNCNPVSGACVCKPHVVGKNCDQCEDGFFKLYSGKGCESCDCNAVGSLNQTCDLNSGQCFCRPGVTGLKCDHCEPRKYGFSMDGCKECECDIIGSKELQCDGSGQCPCLDNVEGRRCDRCKENKYDRQRGCVDCPDCYNLVQNATQIHKDKLKRLSEYLDDIERSPTVVADDEFADELSKLQLNIEGFHDTVVKATGQDSVVQQVQNINERKKEISRTLSEIEENIELATDKVNLADQNITNAENTLDNAKSKLEDITNSFEVNGKKALEDAWERAKIVGQQSEKMTEIAQEARDIADKLDKQANDITERANEAKNKSNEAYLLAENALSLQENVISTKERELRNDLNKLENNLNKTKELTEEVSEKAKEAKKEALDLLSQANNLVIPEVDVGVFKRKSDEIKELADDLRVQADKLLEENDELVVDINEQVVTGIDLLERGNDQKQDLDDYTGDIHFAKKIAEVSIKLAEDRINQTQETYKILSGFDKEAQKNKKAAEEALGQIPEIEKKIIDALQKTSQGQESISDAKKNADSAFKKAEDADDLAKKASANAEKIKSEAEVLYANASGLEKEADLMSERISRTKAEFKQLEDQNRSNETLVAHAKDNVGRAGKETQEASKKVNELLEDVQEIINELQNLPNIDEKALDELENKLKIAEQKVADAKLDEKLAHYKAQQKIHDDLIAEYEKEIEMLEKDVENIQQIANSLPDGCFKKIDLEP